MLKALALLGLALVGLGIVAVAALPWLVDLLALRSWVTFAAGQAVGRPVVFASISVRPLPFPTILVRGVEVADEPAFGDGPLLSIGEGRIGMRLWPLLRGRVEASEVTLSDVRLHVVEDEHGRLNVASLGPVPPAPSAPRPGSPRSSSGLAIGVLAPRLRVVNATVRYRKVGARPSEFRASRITATLSHDAPNGAMRVSGEALMEPSGARLALIDATVTPAPGRPLAESAVNGVVELESSDVSEVVRAALAAPEVQGTARARLQVAGTLGRPRATGALTLDRATLVEERRRCGEPSRRRLALEKVNAPLVLAPPQLDSAPVTARMAGGQISLHLGVRLDRGPAVTVKELRVSGVEASAILIDYLCQPWGVRGPLDLTGELAFRGPDYAQSAVGSGRLKMGHGKVTGRDATAVLEEVLAITGTAAALARPDRRRPADASLDFESITATYRVAAGVIRSDDLLYESRAFRIAGAGTYELADGRVALDATFTQGDNQVRATIAGLPGALRVTPTSVRIREGRDLKRFLDRLLR